MVFCQEHPKRDQNPKFTPLSETTSIPTPFTYGVPPPGFISQEFIVHYRRGQCCHWNSSALSTEKYKRYINILLLFIIISWLFSSSLSMMHPMQSNLDFLDLTLHEIDSGRHLFLFLFLLWWLCNCLSQFLLKFLSLLLSIDRELARWFCCTLSF